MRILSHQLLVNIIIAKVGVKSGTVDIENTGHDDASSIAQESSRLWGASPVPVLRNRDRIIGVNMLCGVVANDILTHNEPIARL